MAPHTPHRSDAPRRSRGAPRACHTMAHRSSWGAPIWPPTPPIARTRPGAAVARLGLDTGCLIAHRRESSDRIARPRRARAPVWFGGPGGRLLATPLPSESRARLGRVGVRTLWATVP